MSIVICVKSFFMFQLRSRSRTGWIWSHFTSFIKKKFIYLALRRTWLSFSNNAFFSSSTNIFISISANILKNRTFSLFHLNCDSFKAWTEQFSVFLFTTTAAYMKKSSKKSIQICYSRKKNLQILGRARQQTAQRAKKRKKRNRQHFFISTI